MVTDFETTASLDTLAGRIRDALLRSHASREEWLRGTFDLGHSLKAAREALPANQDFSRWLIENGIELNKNDRAALIHLADHEAEARHYFERNPGAWSWQWAWEAIKPSSSREEHSTTGTGGGATTSRAASGERGRKSDGSAKSTSSTDTSGPASTGDVTDDRRSESESTSGAGLSSDSPDQNDVSTESTRDVGVSTPSIVDRMSVWLDAQPEPVEEVVGAMIANLASMLLDVVGTPTADNLECHVMRLADLIWEQVLKRQQWDKPMSSNDKEGTPLKTFREGSSFRWHPIGSVAHPEFSELPDVLKQTSDKASPVTEPVTETQESPADMLHGAP
jgi:hypothetical protein